MEVPQQRDSNRSPVESWKQGSMGSDSLEVAMGEMALTPQVVGQKTKLRVNVLSSIAQRLRICAWRGRRNVSSRWMTS